MITRIRAFRDGWFTATVTYQSLRKVPRLVLQRRRGRIRVLVQRFECCTFSTKFKSDTVIGAWEIRPDGVTFVGRRMNMTLSDDIPVQHAPIAFSGMGHLR